MNITKRIGTFFLVIGVALLVLFFASDYQDQPSWSFLLLGVVALGLGVSLSVSGREPHEPVERFRLMRRMFGSGGPEKGKEDKDSGDEEGDQ